ncbi:MAG: hypothetical protein EBT24_11920 [Betaproteobacteria bacterium]|nr:hypothetical protein [Betaproteobacteria bacterium]NBT11664.1 hypothetical protein [Betaproteobacteria bacterium]
MTAQVSETLFLQGQKVRLCEAPLNDYFALTGVAPKFRAETTACWRGYVGSWEIKDSRLYLIGIGGSYEDGSPVTLESLFPGFAKRVFAHWYSGTLRVPQGELLKYRHMGWASTFECDLLIEVQDGLVKSMQVQYNRDDAGRGDE